MCKVSYQISVMLKNYNAVCPKLNSYILKVNEEIMERLYEDFLEILEKDNKLPLEQREKEAALLAREEFEKRQ